MSIESPEEDTAVRKLKDALARKAEMNIVGYNYQSARSFDTLEAAAKNEGASSGFVNAGIGLGMGLGLGGQFGNQMSNISSKMDIDNTPAQNTIKCSKCGADIDSNLKFCPECGNKLGNYCKKCGAKLIPGKKFCPECGTSQILTCPKCNAEILGNVKFCPECGENLGGGTIHE